MSTAGNRSSVGVNVRGGGANIGSLTVQALPATVATTNLTTTTGVVANLPNSVQRPVANPVAVVSASLIANTLRVPPSTLRVVTPVRPTYKRPNDDILSVSHLRVNNGTFTSIDKSGISSLRPELISLMDFRSLVADNNGSPTKVGRLFDLQFQAKALREKTLLDVINNVRTNPSTTTDLDLIQTQFFSKFQQIDQLVNFYKDTIETIDTLKRSFDVKTLPTSLFNTRVFQTLQGFYSSRMTFPANSFEGFTNTKILYQLMFDFRAIAENYSLNLMNLTDPDRTGDSNPLNIDKTYDGTSGLEFKMSTIGSPENVPQNAAEDAFFIRFLHGLPSVTDDRIKLLITLLSKEFRVSSGLGVNEVQSVLVNKFGMPNTDGNPFLHIMGSVGATALDPPQGTQSLSSLFFLDLSNNSFVLPFETKYIDVNSTQKVYVPGANYFVDSILNVTNNQFNTKPLIDYVQDFTNKLGDSIGIIEKLFDFKETQSALAGVSVLERFLSAVRDGLNGLVTGSGQLSIQSGVVAALFRLSATDTTLKSMLFQYILLLAMKIQNESVADLRFITTNIANELVNLTGLKYVQLDSTTDPSLSPGRNLTPFLDKLALDIQDQVYKLLNVSHGSADEVRTLPVDPRLENRSIDISKAQTQTDNIRATSAVSALKSATGGHDGRVRITLGAGPVGTSFSTARLGAASTISSTLTNTHGSMLEGLVQTAMQLDSAASPGTSTSIYVDIFGRTRFNKLSASTLVLMIYEIFCDLTSKYVNADFTKSENHSSVDVLVDLQFNDIQLDVIANVIAHVDTILSPSSIGIVGASNQPLGRATVVNNNAIATGANTAPGASALVHPGGPTLTDLVQSTPNVSLSRIASGAGISSGQAQSSIIMSQQFTGTQNPSISQRVSSTAITAAAAGLSRPIASSFLLDQRLQENSLYSIKQKVYEEDLAIANICHILFAIYTRLTNAKERVTTYFTPSMLSNFLNNSQTSPQDITSILNPAQVKIIVSSRDSLTRKLHASGYELGQVVGFISNDPNEVNVKNSIVSLLSQPDYQEHSLADSRVKLMVVGVPAGFSNNLADTVDTTSITRNTFSSNKEFDVVELLVHKRDLEHEELVYKPMRFLFDLSIFSGGFENLNIASGEDFNNILGKVSVADYISVANPENHTISDIDNDQKYSFLSSENRRSMFKNHIVSDLLSSYTSYLTAVKMTEEVFVDINSATYLLHKPATTTGSSSNSLSMLTQDFQSKIVRFLNVVKKKNIPNRPFQELLNDANIDEETKDILRTMAYGNVVFNPDLLMQKLLSPKLFDRVFTIPVSVDAFPIDPNMTNSTSIGRAVLSKLQQSGDVTTDPVTNELYLTKKEKNSPVFEDYFVTIDLVTNNT